MSLTHAVCCGVAWQGVSGGHEVWSHGGDSRLQGDGKDVEEVGRGTARPKALGPAGLKYVDATAREPCGQAEPVGGVGRVAGALVPMGWGPWLRTPRGVFRDTAWSAKTRVFGHPVCHQVTLTPGGSGVRGLLLA